jgi:molybdate transport system substrate-binding protein
VVGSNISQTLQFIDSGNAELGFVALSQVATSLPRRSGAPADLYDPIFQDAVLLETGADNPAAAAFLEFLKGPEAAAVIARYGYAAGE